MGKYPGFESVVDFTCARTSRRFRGVILRIAVQRMFNGALALVHDHIGLAQPTILF